MENSHNFQKKKGQTQKAVVAAGGFALAVKSNRLYFGRLMVTPSANRLTSSLKKHTFYNLLINNILYLCVT